MFAADFQCRLCGHRQEEWFLNRFAAEHATTIKCDNPACRVAGSMDRLPAAPGFKVEGFNAKNGYSSSD